MSPIIPIGLIGLLILLTMVFSLFNYQLSIINFQFSIQLVTNCTSCGCQVSPPSTA